MLLLDFWPLGRLAPSHGSWNIRDLVREKLPLLAPAVASSIVTFVVQRRGGAVMGLDIIPLNVRVANAVVSYAAYVAKMLWPDRLAVFYPYVQPIPGWWVAG